MKCGNRSCPYLYLQTGKCELNPKEYDSCFSSRMRKKLRELM